MQLHFERSGGFTGLLIEVSVDTDDLPAAKEEEWKRALAEIGFFDLPANLIGEHRADSFVYRLTVATAEKEHTVLCSEENVPEKLQPLLRQLTIMARQG